MGTLEAGPACFQVLPPAPHASTTLIIHVTRVGPSSRATARGRAGTHPACAPPSPVEAETEAPQLPFHSHFHALLSSAPLLPTMARVVLPGGQRGSSPSQDPDGRAP